MALIRRSARFRVRYFVDFENNKKILLRSKTILSGVRFIRPIITRSKLRTQLSNLVTKTTFHNYWYNIINNVIG